MIAKRGDTGLMVQYEALLTQSRNWAMLHDRPGASICCSINTQLINAYMENISTATSDFLPHYNIL